MAYDSDVARITAALRSPGIRYKNFGNDPVRGAAAPAGDAAGSFPLLGAAMAAAVAATAPQPAPAPEPVAEPEPDPGAATYEVPTVADAAPSGLAAASFEVEPVGDEIAPPLAGPTDAPADVPAGHFPFGALPAYPEPSLSLAAAAPEVAAPVIHAAPTVRGVGGYRLLEAIGLPGEAARGAPFVAPPAATPPSAGMFGMPPRAAAPSGTMQSLGYAAAHAHWPTLAEPVASETIDAWAGTGIPAPPAEGGLVLAQSSALLPSALVTLPLTEVLRLIATGAPTASSSLTPLWDPSGVYNSR